MVTTSVFVSYSTRDRDSCTQLRKGLEDQDLDVRVDEQDIEPGAELRERIRKLIDETRFTVCLVSRNSLRSVWVIWEVIQLLDDDRFIPARLDDAFLADDFTDRVQDELGERLERIGEQMRKRLDEGTSVADLSALYESLTRVRNDVSTVVQRLRDTHVVDVSPASFEQGFLELYQRITGNEQLLRELRTASSLDNTDYDARRQAIEDLIVSGSELPHAVKLTLDLLREFHASDADTFEKAMLLSAKINQLVSEYESERGSPEGASIEFRKYYHDTVTEHAVELYGLIPTDLPRAA